MKTIFLLVSLLLGSIPCTQAQQVAPKPSLAIVMGVDISQTANDYTALDQAYYKSLIACLLKLAASREVHFAFATIGNPSDQVLQRLVLNGPVAKKPHTMSEALVLKRKNETIRKRNAEEAEKFLSMLKIPQAANHQQSDLNGFFRKAQHFLQEPMLAQDTKKILLCYTDGIHDVKGDKNLQIHLPTVQLYAAGWKNQQGYNHFTHFESPQGFLLYLHTLNQ